LAGRGNGSCASKLGRAELLHVSVERVEIAAVTVKGVESGLAV
jgi:hypothetical protein